MAKPEDCRFTKSHEWIFAEGDVARVGISDHAQGEITDVVFVELPQPGRKVKGGEACAVIESVKAAFDIYAPASGQIVGANDKLGADPAVVNHSPYDEGWLFELKLSAPDELKGLMSYEDYQAFVKAAAH